MSEPDNELLTEGITPILQPDSNMFYSHYLIYRLINAIKEYEIKKKTKILDINWSYYGYSNFKFISYDNIKFTIGDISMFIVFGKCLQMVAYNVPGKNGITSIKINISDNSKTYYSKENGFITLDNPNEIVDLSKEIESLILSLK